MRKLNTARRPLGKGGVDVDDLKPERTPVRLNARLTLLKEDREVVAVLQGDGLPVRNFELHREPEHTGVPGPRARQIRHRDPEVVELDHPEVEPTQESDRLSNRDDIGPMKPGGTTALRA